MAAKHSLIAWFGISVSGASADPPVPFEEVYRAELPRIYNYFCYRVGDAALAEDLTSFRWMKP